MMPEELEHAFRVVAAEKLIAQRSRLWKVWIPVRYSTYMYDTGRMAEIPVRVLSQETAEVLARVKAGEEITLTEGGTVIARIVPASGGPLNGLVSAGRVRPASAHGSAPRPKVHGREGLDAGALMRGMRDDERY